MADIKDRRPGGGGAKGDTVLYHDEGDNTWSESVAAHLRLWNPTDLAWDRAIVDDTTGALVVTGAVTTSLTRPSTATNTTVADTASSTTLLSANANRLGATITNDSSARLYVNLDNSAASTSNYSVSLSQHGYLEVPFGYTGEIRGIWASDPGDGAARITEFTA